jgi:hypothetical protein
MRLCHEKNIFEILKNKALMVYKTFARSFVETFNASFSLLKSKLPNLKIPFQKPSSKSLLWLQKAAYDS